MSRKKDERQKEIRDLLMDRQSVKVSELADLLQVTPETIRKDLDELEEQNLIVREHGVASIRLAVTELPMKIRSQNYPDEKRRITMRALQEIQNGQIVFIDGGSTIMNGIQMLRSKKDLTIVTNYLLLAIECAQMGFDVIIIGGMVNQQILYSRGQMAVEDLRHFHFDVALLGTGGLKDLDGFSLFTLEEIGFFQEVCRRSNRVVLLMNKQKIYEKGKFISIPFGQADMLITNPLTAEERKIFMDIAQVVEV